MIFKNGRNEKYSELGGKREKEIIIFTAMTLTGPIRRQDRGGWTPVFFNRHGASDILIA